MDYEPNEDQQAILAAIEQLLVRHAGAARAIDLNRDGAYDADLDAALGEAGFHDLALGDVTCVRDPPVTCGRECRVTT